MTITARRMSRASIMGYINFLFHTSIVTHIARVAIIVSDKNNLYIIEAHIHRNTHVTIIDDRMS